MSCKGTIKIRPKKGLKSQNTGVPSPSLIKGEHFMADGIAQPH